MDWLIKSLTFLHVIAGFGSLIVFWIPAFTRKGGVNHVKLGRVYVKLMWVVVFSAALLSVKNIIIGSYSAAAFLGFISLITANTLWYGIAILKNKKGLSSNFKNLQLSLQFAIVLSALGLIAYGIALNGQGSAILMFIFGGLGLTELPPLIKNLKKSEAEINWLKDHIVGMCSSGIAAYTAFFVFGGRQFLEGWLTGYWSIIPWVAPGVLGTIGINIAVRKHMAKKQQKPKVV